MNLQEQGFRYVLRGKEGRWLRPVDVLPTDIDCTDMNDNQFASACVVPVVHPALLREAVKFLSEGLDDMPPLQHTATAIVLQALDASGVKVAGPEATLEQVMDAVADMHAAGDRSGWTPPEPMPPAPGRPSADLCGECMTPRMCAADGLGCPFSDPERVRRGE